MPNFSTGGCNACLLQRGDATPLAASTKCSGGCDGLLCSCFCVSGSLCFCFTLHTCSADTDVIGPAGTTKACTPPTQKAATAMTVFMLDRSSAKGEKKRVRGLCCRGVRRLCSRGYPWGGSRGHLAIKIIGGETPQPTTDLTYRQAEDGMEAFNWSLPCLRSPLRDDGAGLCARCPQKQ